MFYPKKIISKLRNIYDLFENISHTFAYFTLSTINYSQYLLSRIIISFDVFQGNWYKLKKFKNNSCVSVFGNGPSLKNLSLEDLNGTDIVTCNFFNRHPNAAELKSTFHVVADGFEKNASLDELLSHDSSAYLMHYSFNNLIDKPEKTIFYFVPSILTIARWRRNKLYKSFPLPAPLNSVQLALLLAILLKYKKIYLYGVDEDQLANPFIQENTHFYEEDESSAQGVSGVLTSTYDERIKSKYLSMIGYKKIRAIADYYGIKVINKNKNSYVDAFEFE